ncbi:MAG TPA: sigma-54 dependent transcriptional regulator [Anaerohalosphaeraceae bacterium]|nr:sigma-54 dependent transcriptional regulator [Anaerohalosphaeraceae bacterium]
MTPTPCETVMSNVLILEPDSHQAAQLLEELARRGIRGTVAVSDTQATSRIERIRWNLIFVAESFLTLYSHAAESILRTIRTSNPEAPLVLVASEDSSRKALEALRKGYAEFLVKPVDRRKAEGVLDCFVPAHPYAAMDYIYPTGTAVCIAGHSAALRQTVDLAKRAAPTSAPILIEGESGTGKELLAQLIHENSRRSEGPFIKVNCAALTESLLESELFGHEKGAFTGALFSRKGRFEAAHGGTLLLDEITETPTAFQAKLLRAIEQMCFERVGGNDPVHVNVRILSTTNRPIVRAVEQGTFRADLYYRLSAIRLMVPPLRQRQEDIVQMVWLFVNEFAAESARRITAIDRQTLHLFEQYRWPGNIRQLRNMVRSAMILGSGEVLSVQQIPWLLDEIREGLEAEIKQSCSSADLAGVSLEELERRAILDTLDRQQGNQSQAARILGISDRTLREKVKRYRGQQEPAAAALL